AQRGVRIDVAPGADAVVRGDRLRLKQVLMNLVSNAIKYNRPAGWIRIDCAPQPGGRVRITVADSGQGISASGLARLFQPFERLGAEQGDIEGTGIGLSICRRLVVLMGGEIDATSDAGKGSAFWVELPADQLAEAPSQPVSRRADGVSVTKTRRSSVLYV